MSCHVMIGIDPDDNWTKDKDFKDVNLVTSVIVHVMIVMSYYHVLAMLYVMTCISYHHVMICYMLCIGYGSYWTINT